MTYTITLGRLKERGACEEGLKRFKEMFGEFCEITLEKAVEYVQKYGTDDLWWFYNYVESLSIIPIACGNNHSDGISHSFGLFHCRGAYQCFFVANKKGIANQIFSSVVSEDRAEKVSMHLREALNGWHPKWTNSSELRKEYPKNGKALDESVIEYDKEEAWKDMPKAAIDYISSIPEFDADIFEEITGIRVGE